MLKENVYAYQGTNESVSIPTRNSHFHYVEFAKFFSFLYLKKKTIL